MQESYIFPIIVSNDNDGFINAKIPDFHEVTSGNSEEDVIKNAQEVIALHIIDMENLGEAIPNPSELNSIELENNEKVIFIQLWMPYFRTATKEVYVKKTLTIPKWLDMLAKENDVNFSAALVKGVKIELGMDIR